ncbi:hypothetical protein Pint_25748 [Pistacia integerrima]|uniref:Uncharacterized protein n=1 Tax=Pistacia integerrima TaxID=434235 RepID=A0ACC0YDN5_9ROSI|nr:hypothetical protein Pint_25748 [Pistacia integerrima]
MMMPTGFRFNPTDEELIHILEKKVTGHEMLLHNTFIVERNVYELDPQDLEWDHTVLLSNNERYCYYLRETDSREVSGRGWWRATGHVKKIYANKGHVIGYKRPLTFLRFINRERKRKNAFKTNWIMHEYSLHSNTTEWRICKIKYKGKESITEELKNIRKGHISRNDLKATGSTMEQEKQPAPLEIDYIYESYSEGSNSTGMMLDFVCNQQKPYNFRQNMQMEESDEQKQYPKGSYDPILTHITTANYYFDMQFEQPDSLEEIYPSLWNW